MKENKTRIYTDIEKIEPDKVQEFWNKRASETTSVKGVLLGEGLSPNSAELSNDKEKGILTSLLANDKKYSILDIGSGIGRWVENLQTQIAVYHGIDFSEKFVAMANENYKESPDVHFFYMSATHLNKSTLLEEYDLVIMNGVLMYINDDQLLYLFKELNELISANGCIYLQESVSTIWKRLTLKDFYSQDLNEMYNAIYRTKNEYDQAMGKELPSFECEVTGLLLDKETGARDETNAQYWFLKRRNIK